MQEGGTLGAPAFSPVIAESPSDGSVPKTFFSISAQSSAAEGSPPSSFSAGFAAGDAAAEGCTARPDEDAASAEGAAAPPAGASNSVAFRARFAGVSFAAVASGASSLTSASKATFS